MKRPVEVVLIMSVLVACWSPVKATSTPAAVEIETEATSAEAAREIHERSSILSANEGADESDIGNDNEDWDDFDDEVDLSVADPLYYWNNAMFHFNDKLYFWLLKPVSKGYRTVVPETARLGVRNFFHNLMFPVRFLGAVLQGKGVRAQAELARFMFNTTFGVLGFGNPAKRFSHLNPPEEDIGQAFGKWGIGEGLYLVWPIFGPSTARDSVGLFCNSFLDPVGYVEPTRDALAIRATKVVNNTSLRIGDYEALKEAAINPYTALRDAYIQNRRKDVAD
jgi:phospholipid-binding lipoprotein MlaA